MRIQSQAAWEQSRFAYVPTPWVADLRTEFERQKSHNEGHFPALFGHNVWLRERTEAYEAFRIPLDATDGDICALAVKQAAEVMGLTGAAHGVEAYRAAASRYVMAWGIEPPEAKKYADRPAIARMTCSQWWRRKLRTIHGRAIEAEAIRLAYVHKRGQIYASDITVKQREQQKRRNLAILQQTQAHNKTTGQDFTLAELAEKAVSNPAIRRGELMVRLAGFEAVAKGVGHVGVFFTVTCPSRMHRMKTSRSGAPYQNEKFDGTTPKQAAGYLQTMWARVRAAWKRAKLVVYGFRIAEPHHDGCPHWHLLLFMDKAQRAQIIKTFAGHAMAEDAHELKSREARKARFFPKFMDPNKGSAAGYVAKYISKNIDGFEVQFDLEGENLSAVTGSQRVEAWASRWGIRQFQQIGGPPVGVWRELRRLEKDGDYTDTVAAARAATDKTEERQADWGAYVGVMGLERAQGWPVIIAKTRTGERYDAAADECYPAPPTKYGDDSPAAVFGVKDARLDRAFPTRLYQWEIKRKTSRVDGERGNFHAKGDEPAHLVDGNWLSGFLGVGNVEAVETTLRKPARIPGCNGAGGAVGGILGGGSGLVLGPDFSAPWSPVNNCTEVKSVEGIAGGGFAGGGIERGGKEGESDVSGASGRGLEAVARCRVDVGNGCGEGAARGRAGEPGASVVERG